jgi:glycosyltransferase involved in cell wall biosynthesis
VSTVDVIIPAFNSAATIGAAVASALSITDARVIVVDDGSLDDTAELARQAGASVIRQQNGGASKARARGLLDSSSDFVVFLDADDEVIATGALASIQMLESNPNLAVAAGRVIGIHPGGQSQILPRHFEVVSTESLLKTGFGPWPPTAAVVRRSSLELASQLDLPSLHTRFAEDYELIIRLSLVGQIGMHDEVSARYRLFDGKSSSAAERALRDKENIRRYYADLSHFPVELMTEREIRAAAQMRNVKILWAQGRKLSALGRLARGVATDPFAALRKVQRSRSLGARR